MIDPWDQLKQAAGQVEVAVEQLQNAGDVQDHILALAHVSAAATELRIAAELAVVNSVTHAAISDAVDDVVDPGRLIFEAYSRSRKGMAVNDQPIPTWDGLGDDVRKGWNSGADAFIAALTHE